MNTTTFLEVMSIQRHDFLNHLQVITGLIQLNKGDRVKEYIRQVSVEMERLSKVAHLAVPEVAAVLLVGHFSAGKHHVKVLYDINTNIGCSPVPGSILAEALEEAINQSLECLAQPGVPNRFLKISITESDKNYLFKISFPEPPGMKAETARARLAEVGRKMASYGGKIGFAVSGSGGEIFVAFPVKQPEQGSFST